MTQGDVLLYASQGGDPHALIVAAIGVLIDWGSTDGEEDAEHTCAWLVREGRGAMAKHFPALVRWLRREGRSVEDVAAEWGQFLAEKAA